MGQPGYGPLWYRYGTVNYNGSISYNNATSYDSGLNPTIAATAVDNGVNNTPGILLEAHQQQDGVGQLWSRTASYNPTNRSWTFDSGATEYDSGVLPQVAAGPGLFTGGSTPGWEVHQSSAAASPLWYRTFTLTVP